MKRQISMLVMFLFGISNAFANGYYVSKTGNDKNAGTQSNPFLTIQKAADNMSEGDVCYIKKGIYRETVIPKKDGVTFKLPDNGDR